MANRSLHTYGRVGYCTTCARRVYDELQDSNMYTVCNRVHFNSPGYQIGIGCWTTDDTVKLMNPDRRKFIQLLHKYIMDEGL